MVSAFDFAGYLSTTTTTTVLTGNAGDEHWDVALLGGGLVNLTARATVRGGQQSLILKYAPPFIAAVGDTAPLSPFRQVIEERALNLLASAPEVLLAQTLTRTSIPKVVSNDTANHVLIIADLGRDLFTLDQWLVPALSTISSDGRPPPRSALCTDVGTRVGQLLAAIHGLDVSRADFQHFVNEDARRLVRDEVVDNMADVFEQVGFGREVTREWCATIKAEFEEGYRKGVFSMGDLWTGSILVSAEGTTVGLVDWEFAGEARPLQDMAQLCAHLRALGMSVPSGSASHASITAFTTTLCSSYRAHTRSLNSLWLRDESLRECAMKSARILHGRELVYNAVERYRHVSVALGASEDEAEENVKRIVGCGIGYVNGLDEEEFLRLL